MLAWPFPYIATTAGWMTAELGRQPWLVYGLMRTADGALAQASPAAASPSRRSAGSASTSCVGVAFLGARRAPARARPRADAVEEH